MAATVVFSPVGNGFQWFGQTGLVLAGGKINTYAAGSTTRQATYTDNTGTVANANPIILDSTGRYAQEIWLDVTLIPYKFVITDALGVTQFTLDNIPSTTTGAINISYTAAATGSVTTTVLNDLNNHLYNPARFGAKGDGTTDDTAAIQAAANSGIGRLVSDSSKTYRCTSAISITNTSFEFNGGTYFFDNGATGNGFVFSSNDSTQIFTLTGVKIITNAATTGTAVSASYSVTVPAYQKSVTITDVNIGGNSATKTWGNGIVLTKCTNSRITNATIFNTSPSTLTSGITITGPCTNTDIINPVIYGASTSIIANTGANIINVVNAYLTATSIAVDLQYVVATNGSVFTFTGGYYDFTSFGIRGTYVIAMAVTGILFQKNNAGTWIGMQLSNSSECVIQSCNFGNNLRAAPWTGLNIITSSNMITVTENVFDDSASATASVLLDSSTQFCIVKNNRHSDTGAGISSASNSNLIQDNVDFNSYILAPPSQDLAGISGTINLSIFVAKGNAEAGFFNLYNTGAAANVTGLINAMVWMIVRIVLNAANITFVNGATLNLQGAANYNPASGAVLTLLATPDGAGGIIWKEIGRRT